MSRVRTIGRWALGGILMLAGTGHLTFLREEHRAQVPEWVPVGADTTVLASGVVEIAQGAALVALPKRRRIVGAVVSAFLVAVFPGNIAQYRNNATRSASTPTKPVWYACSSSPSLWLGPFGLAKSSARSVTIRQQTHPYKEPSYESGAAGRGQTHADRRHRSWSPLCWRRG